MIFLPCKYKGMNLFSLLMTLTLFSGIFLAINQWASHQRHRAMQIYQYVQAIQIAENQQQKRLFGLAEPEVRQNKLEFRLEYGENSVKVRYDLGNVNLTFQ